MNRITNRITNTIKFLIIYITFFSCSAFVHASTIADTEGLVYQETKTTAELMQMARMSRIESKSYRSPAQQSLNNKNDRRNWNNDPQKVFDIWFDKQNKNTGHHNEAKKIVRSSPAQTVGLNFTAATLGNVLDPLVIPPNLNGSVGSTQYVLMTYGIIRSFDKTTGLPDGILNLDASTFFGVSADDVRIDYDRFSQRWFMSCEGINATTGNVSTIVLAVSQGAVITDCSSWTIYTFSNAKMIPQIRPLGSGDLDYQQLAIDQNAVYISADTFDQNGNFHGTSTLVIQKSSLNGGPVVSKVFFGILPGPSQNLASGFTPPADNFDTNPTYGYIVNATNNSYLSGNIYKTVFLYRISNPGSSSPSLGSQVTIQVPPYTDSANAPYKGNLFGASAFLQTGGCNFVAPHVRNRQLYVCHNIQVNNGGVATRQADRVGIRWYQFDLTGDPTGNGGGTETVTTVPALVQWGTLYDPTASTTPNFYFNPSIMTNKNGDLAIGCTISGAHTYPNVVYAGRQQADAPNTLRTPVAITNSSNPYNFGPFENPSNGNIGQRWGDLSSMSSEPVNDLDIWATQEFAAVYNGWGVQVTQLQSV